MKVFVISKNGEPLMPTYSGTARKLLDQGKATVIKRIPFTIQLLYQTSTEYIQSVRLGIDTGYKNIGFSCITDKEELISGEVKLDDKMKSRIDAKRMYRKHRRNRLWYRKPRFLNRTKTDGWLPPSVMRRYETHIHIINKIKNLLPINNIIIEVGKFDIQKINNPNIKRVEYQQGNLYSYNNVKSYLISRESGRCQICNKNKGVDNWNVHHIISKKNGGTDRTENLALLHSICHKKLHQNLDSNNSNNKINKNKQYKDATFMNIINKKFIKDLICALTFGSYTFTKRNELELEKSHSNDAFIIAGGEYQTRSVCYKVIQKRRNNRKLQINRKGFRPSIRKNRYSQRPLDLVKIFNKIFTVKGVHSYGKSIIIMDKKGNVINKSIKKLDNWIYHNGSMAWSIKEVR